MNTIRQTLYGAAIFAIAAFLGLAPISARANETGLPPDVVKI